jgi:hypothetical protein
VLSRSSASSLSAPDEREIARALAKGPGIGIPYQTLVSLGRRTLSVSAVQSPVPDLTWQRFSDAVGRRADASAHRLLPVVAAGDFDGCHWVAYEIGSAVSLATDVGQQWPAAPCLNLISDVGQALDEAASQGLLPWELAPESIFVDTRFGALLSDFGTAREALGDMSVDHGDAWAFVSPEVQRGEGVGERSGVFVCGALMYQLLSGQAPQRGGLTRMRPDLPEDIDLVVARATARDSLERYRDAGELSQSARRALLDELAGPATPLPAAEMPAAPAPADFATPPPPETPAAPAPVEPDFAPASQPWASEAAAADFAPAAEVFTSTTSPFAPAVDPFEPPVAEPSPEFRRADDDALFDLAAAPVYEWQFPVPRFVKVFAVAGVVFALALGAAAGFFLGGDDSEDPPPVAYASGSGLVVTLPPGWSAGADGRSDLSAYPTGDGFSGLTVSLEEGGVDPGQRDDPVRLGDIDVWRDASEAPAVIRYVAPTADGRLTIACEASPGAARGTLQLCERAASTLDLGPVRVLPLPGVIQQPGMRAAMDRLAADRAAGRRRLADARRPSGQREVANALARSHERAAGRLSDLPEAAAIAAAARQTARAYRSLARAAGGKSSRPWNAAREAVRRGDAALAEAIAANNAAAP